MELKERNFSTDNKKALKIIVGFKSFLNELKNKSIPEEIMKSIEDRVVVINQYDESDKKWLKLLRKTQKDIIDLLVHEVKIVPKKYYMNLWMSIGMAAYGIPIGIALSAGLDNFAYIGIGIPIGMSIGIGIGTKKDKKAKEEGRQLDVDFY